MPNKTIYVKDTDLPLLEQAQEQLGDSVSSMFAEFLRERVAKLTPEEWHRTGLMAGTTEITIEGLIGAMLAHDSEHLDQLSELCEMSPAARQR